MRHSYLEVTYRKGRALAAYFYLPREEGDRRVRTERADPGLLIDFTEDGRAIGIEITTPSNLHLSQLNHVLEGLGLTPVAKEDIAPLAAA
jgi:uncharacterized protein YuzE